MKVINTKAKLIVAGKVKFVPATPVEVDFEPLAKLYPDLNDYLADGTLKKLTEEEAVKAEEDLEAKTVVMLKKIAEKKGINTRGMKKAEIIEAIRG